MMFTTVTCQQCGLPFTGWHTRLFCDKCSHLRNLKGSEYKQKNPNNHQKSIQTVDGRSSVRTIPIKRYGREGSVLTYKDLITITAIKNDLPIKQVEKIFREMFATIERALAQGERVQILGFGTFSVRETVARKGRNPRTGEPIDLPATKHVHFTQSKKFKGLLKC